MGQLRMKLNKEIRNQIAKKKKKTVKVEEKKDGYCQHIISISEFPSSQEKREAINFAVFIVWVKEASVFRETNIFLKLYCKKKFSYITLYAYI